MIINLEALGNNVHNVLYKCAKHKQYLVDSLGETWYVLNHAEEKSYDTSN